MEPKQDSQPEPSYYTFQVHPDPRGRVNARLATHWLRGADRSARGVVVLRLGVTSEQLSEMSTRDQYTRIAADVIDALQGITRANGGLLHE